MGEPLHDRAEADWRPQVAELGDETFAARASVVEGGDRDRLYAAHAAEHPTFAEYPNKTTRVIPVIRLERVGWLDLEVDHGEDERGAE